MEKRCCICGNVFIDYGKNAAPIRDGVCCPVCNTRFVLVSRMKNFTGTFEIAKNENERIDLAKRLADKNFEVFEKVPHMTRYKNIETEENVIVCTL